MQKYNKQKPFLQDNSAGNKINDAAQFFDTEECFPVFHAWIAIRLNATSGGALVL